MGYGPIERSLNGSDGHRGHGQRQRTIYVERAGAASSGRARGSSPRSTSGG